MYNAIVSLHPIAILVVSLIGFLIGGLWYSPMLFVKPWMEEMKITPEKAKAASKGRTPVIFTTAILCTVLSTFTLASLVAARHIAEPLGGAAMGLLVGVGLVASRQATNMVFEMRTLRHFLIVSGHEVAALTILGAILAVWR